jgi:hypothetical protein
MTRYHADLQAVEAAAKRVHYDSSLAKVVECRRRQDEEAVQWRARHKECITRMHSDDRAGPSGHSGGQ